MKERGIGYKISLGVVYPGVVYPVFQSLGKQGFLKSSKKFVSGKVRKYYKTTGKGFKMIEASKVQFKEFVVEI